MINVMYAGNYKVFDGLLISVLSMVKHTKEPINIIFLTMDLSEVDPKFLPINEEHSKYINKILKDVNKESCFTIIDVTQIFKDNLINSVNLKNHFTPYSMLRLIADQIKEMPNKFIYLDTDTIINNNLKELFDIDVTNYEIAIVKDIYNWSDIRRWKIKNYFNAGVMLINLEKSKETGLFNKAAIMCRDKKMLYMDQDALNLSVKYKLMLPTKFNSKGKYNKDIVVHHFCNVRKNGNWFYRIKPWEVELVKSKMHSYDDILDDYVSRKNSPDYPKVKTNN